MDDIKKSLNGIVSRSNRSLIDCILDIQQHRIEREGFLSSFLDHLECFSFGRGDFNQHILYRAWINAREDSDFVALSYTWQPSPPYEKAKPSGNYKVKTRSNTTHWPSPVRDCVFRRIAKYMKSEGVKRLWIDRHSIYQKVCQHNKEHSYTKKECRQKSQRKSEAIQSMDWVYKLSGHPVALLGRPIASERELELLHGILSKKYLHCNVDGNHELFSSVTRRKDARAAIELLGAITSNQWWQRAWTFQENFKGGNAMRLMISHPKELEGPKLDRRDIFGVIEGELCISSANFSRRATQLCCAFETSDEPSLKDVQGVIKEILSNARRYTVLVGESAALTPAIVADVGERMAGEQWDKLPIIANCCDYSTRLDFRELQSLDCSLSIALLATCLLNGEIFCDGQLPEPEIAKMTVTEFIAYHILKPQSPSQVDRKLSFNQGFRFTAPVLTRAGIETRGHLCELGPIIETDGLRYRLRGFKTCGESGLDWEAHYSLAQLCRALRYRSQYKLSSEIERYLKLDAEGNRPYQMDYDYMRLMAAEVAAAVGDGVPVRLGRIWDPNKPRNRPAPPYMAVFVCDGSTVSEELIFTSLHLEDDADDVQRNVSITVDVRKSECGGRPDLRVGRSIFGMCFFTGVTRTDVIFPWPSAFRRIGS
ncbi:hypothetical protein F5Y16DRAFT_377285 [Xylariaceae sp. FL0255]|nr:hypothetical protein F5Y16DRAFT_377285 [Xylariaceae sp. FL0255]